MHCARTMRATVAVLFVVVVVIASAPALSQAFPSRPVRIIVPTGPAGIIDTTIRTLAQEMEKLLAQPIVIDNRAGGGGSVGVGAGAKAVADGHTLVVGYPGPLVTLPMMQKDLPYDPWKELAPVVLLFQAPFYLSARGSSNFSSLKDVLDAARAKPGQVTIGHGGLGGIPHLAVELLKQDTGVDFNQVFYKGDSAAVVDFLGGRLDMVSSNVAAFAGQVKDGSVRILFQFGARRSQHLPNVPTIAEQGYPKVVGTSWIGINVPAGTPGNVIARLNEVIVAGMSSASVRDRLAQFGVDGAASTPQAYGEFLAGERDKWGPLIQRLNLKVE